MILGSSLFCCTVYSYDVAWVCCSHNGFVGKCYVFVNLNSTAMKKCFLPSITPCMASTVGNLESRLPSITKMHAQECMQATTIYQISPAAFFVSLSQVTIAAFPGVMKCDRICRIGAAFTRSASVECSFSISCYWGQVSVLFWLKVITSSWQSRQSLANAGLAGAARWSIDPAGKSIHQGRDEVEPR